MYISRVPEQSIRGGCNIGIHAIEIIGAVTLAIKNYLTAEQIVETIHAHPTTSEVIHCRACCRGRGNTLCLNASIVCQNHMVDRRTEEISKYIENHE